MYCLDGRRRTTTTTDDNERRTTNDARRQRTTADNDGGRRYVYKSLSLSIYIVYKIVLLASDAVAYIREPPYPPMSDLLTGPRSKLLTVLTVQTRFVDRPGPHRTSWPDPSPFYWPCWPPRSVSDLLTGPRSDLLSGPKSDLLTVLTVQVRLCWPFPLSVVFFCWVSFFGIVPFQLFPFRNCHV